MTSTKPKTLGRRVSQTVENAILAVTGHRSVNLDALLEPENDPDHPLKEVFDEFDMDAKGYLTPADIQRLLKGCQLDERLLLGDDVIELLAGMLTTAMDRRNQGRVAVEDFVESVKKYKMYKGQHAGMGEDDSLPAASSDALGGGTLRRTKSFTEPNISGFTPVDEDEPQPITMPSAPVTDWRDPRASGGARGSSSSISSGSGARGSIRLSQAPRASVGRLSKTATVSLSHHTQATELLGDDKSQPQAGPSKTEKPKQASTGVPKDVLDVDKPPQAPKSPSPAAKEGGKPGGFRESFRKSKRQVKHVLAALAPIDHDDWEDETVPEFEKHMGYFERLKWRIQRYWAFEGEKATLYIFVYGANIAMYCAWFARYYAKSHYRAAAPSIPFAKGFTGMLYFDTALIFLTMCRNLLTYVRGFFKDAIASPINKHIVLHRILGYLIVFAGTGHGLAHVMGTVPRLISVASEDVLNSVFIPRVPFDHVPTYAEVAFCTVPGLTGVLLLIILYVMLGTSLQRTREKNFELFWYTHHLFLLYALLNYFHGSSHWLAYMEMPYWQTGPLAIYLAERMLRIYRSTKDITVLQLKHLEPDVTMIEMTKPLGCKPRAGNYVFICIPGLSRFQWHPFTLSSSPEEPILRVHIKDNGDWTHKLHQLAVWSTKASTAGYIENPNKVLPEIQVDGPFGAPAEHIYDFQHAVLVAAGIGVTPFASTLRDIQLRIKTRKGGMGRLCSVDFYWVNRTQFPAKWFQDMLKELRADPIARECVHVYIYLTTNYSKNDIRSLLLWHGLRIAEEVLGRSLLTQLDEYTYWGRPDFDGVLSDTEAKCAKNGKDMAVFYCGPKGLSKQLYSTCRKLTRDTGRTVTYLKENF